MERRDLAGAEAIFARVIARAPEFAEGWNKRATVRYVAENYEGSIDDCEETLKRKPHHFGALAGQGPCYMAPGRPRGAGGGFRRGPGGPPPPPGGGRQPPPPPRATGSRQRTRTRRGA